MARRAAALCALAATATAVLAAACHRTVIVEIDGTVSPVTLLELMAADRGVEDRLLFGTREEALPVTVGLSLRSAGPGPFIVCAGAIAADEIIGGCARADDHVPARITVPLCPRGPGAGAAPAPRAPANGAHVGAITVADSLIPTFSWETVPDALGYEVQLSPDPAFPLGNTITHLTAAPSFRPADDELEISRVQPVGRRWWWRVRALGSADCSRRSAAWYVDLGRSGHDFNGDGYADVAVGSPGWSEGTSANDVGTVYLYYGPDLDGSPAPDTQPDLVLHGEEALDNFGRSVAFVGDANGDGYDDLLVGAPGAVEASGNSPGHAYLFAGGPTADALWETKITGDTPEHFGWSVAAAGDVDADGFADLAIGAPPLEPDGFGRVYVYAGHPDLQNAPVRLFRRIGRAGDDFGRSVAGAGDVNGDGFADVIVGAPQTDVGGFVAGAAYVFAGGPVITLAPWLTVFGQNAGEIYGWSVAGPGDLDGDSFADLAIGAPAAYISLSLDEPQRVDVLHGAPLAADVTTVTLFPDAALEGGFGLAVAGVGDMDGDSHPDLAVGAPFADLPGVSSAGLVAIWRGGTWPLAVTPDATVDRGSLAVGEQLGASVSGADFNGDGFSDLVTGALSSPATGFLSGKAYIFRSDGTAPSAANVVELFAEGMYAGFGASVAWVMGAGGGSAHGGGGAVL
jgi:hypothetical protein